MESILRSLDEETSKILLEIVDILVTDAKGLSIDADNIFTTYENESHSLIRFRIIY